MHAVGLNVELDVRVSEVRLGIERPTCMSLRSQTGRINHCTCVFAMSFVLYFLTVDILRRETTACLRVLSVLHLLIGS